MASSSQSSDGLSLYIEQLNNGTQIADLDQLIIKIDDFLRDWKMNQSKKSRKELMSSYTSDTAKILEGVSDNMGRLEKQLSQISEKDHSTAISVLKAAGNVHWAGLSLLLVAAVLKRLETIKKNKEERLDLLNSMNKLAKVVQKLNGNPYAKSAIQPQIMDSIALVVQGAVLCCSQKSRKWAKRFWMASEDANDIKALGLKLDKMYTELNTNVAADHFLISANNIHKPPHIPFDQNAVGIQDKVDEVVKLLQWENDSTPSLAVVVHGIGGSGKTTLADAVYHSFTDKFNGWKYSKITLVKNLEEHPNVENLQSIILQDLTGENKEVTDIKEGQERLREIMEKQPIFLYIDNALFREHLQELLPRAITNPKKLRLLVTARETNISDVMANCRVKHEIYSMEDLPIDVAIDIICRKIDPERDTSSLLKERPEIKEIAKLMNCCPLFLEVVGGFLRNRNKEAYERVFKWMESGEPFSGHKKDRFDEGRIMFAYDQLERSSQDAFLDICSFFYDWDWEFVAQIVGDEEMKCLHDGALIKRKQDSSDWDDKILNKVLIHDLLLSAGRRKSKDNRFRTPEEFTKFLQNDKGKLPQVKGVWLIYKKWECRGPIDVRAEVLDAMSDSLRVFAMGKWTFVEGKCSKRFDELRFLKADTGSDLPMDLSKLARLTYIGCSSENIKSSELKDMPELKVVDLLTTWNSNDISELGCCEKPRVLSLTDIRGTQIQDLVNLGHLRKLDLSNSYHLLQLPEAFGKLESLEELDLTNCRRLEQLPLGFGKLKALVDLYLRNCESLKELPMNFVNLSSLQRLNLKSCKSLRELPSSFEKLTSLEYLDLMLCSQLISLPERLGELTRLTQIHFNGCTKLSSLPQSLGGLSSLLMSRMYFANCSSLTELPDETSWLSRMAYISFGSCSSLKRIPSQFSKLSCLTKLCLTGCEGIEKLWNDFHGLEALTWLDMGQCRSLSTLPQGFGKLKSLKSLYLSECDSLRTLCDDFHCLGALEYLSLCRCHSLTKLPDGFGKLKSLKFLYLAECDKLKELCDNFHCLEELTELNLSSCCGIAKLPNCFGELRSLQTLNLSRCSKLEELCGNFHRLAALKVLDMSGCCSLTKLPDSFGQLVCLEKADFSGCLNLATLSDDFQSLPSLLRLDLSNCSKLGAECMDRVGATQSLWYANISRSEAMSQRWEQMQREKEEWHFAVETDSFYEGRGETCTGTSKKMRVSVVEMIIWKIFSTEGLLIDASGPPLYLSSLPSHVRLVLIIDRHSRSSEKELKKVLSNLKHREHCGSRELRVLYVGGKSNTLPSGLADRIVAHSTSPSLIYSVIEYFRDVLPKSFFTYDGGAFASTIDIAEGGTIKYSSTWEDISDIKDMNEVENITRNPRDGNGELLRKLCETPENSFLLRKNEKVKVKDLEGKLVLLFREHSGMKDKLQILALEDVYLKLQTSSDYRAEVVWIPNEMGDVDPKEYLRAAARAPWPRVPKPWLIDKDNWWADCRRKREGLVVVDERGKISHKNAMTMILRWGIKAYPFSAIREEELRDTEWNKFESSSQSSCQFIFQNLEHFQLKATEALLRGETIFMCVGSINKMHQFLPELNNALEKLENVVQVFYVGEGVQYCLIETRRFYEEEEEYEMKRNEMESVTSLSLGDAYKFWKHAECLCEELEWLGVDKRIVHVRGMVLAFLSACEWREEYEEGKGISIVAVDENGEMMNGQAEEVVQLLFQSKGEEEHQKLMGDIKSEGFNNVLRRRWINGRIHPKHDPHHPLVTIDDSLLVKEYGTTIICDACSRNNYWSWPKFYRCSVCEKYTMCGDCFLTKN